MFELLSGGLTVECDKIWEFLEAGGKTVAGVDDGGSLEPKLKFSGSKLNLEGVGVGEKLGVVGEGS